MDAVEKKKIPSPRRESNPRTPIVQPVANRKREREKQNERGRQKKTKEGKPKVKLVTIKL
jgi:hypothetical protein